MKFNRRSVLHKYLARHDITINVKLTMKIAGVISNGSYRCKEKVTEENAIFVVVCDRS
jgi:hypothetical protein